LSGKPFIPKNPKREIPKEEQITLEPELEEALANATDAEMCDIAGKGVGMGVGGAVLQHSGRRRGEERRGEERRGEERRGEEHLPQLTAQSSSSAGDLALSMGGTLANDLPALFLIRPPLCFLAAILGMYTLMSNKQYYDAICSGNITNTEGINSE
ncbi:Tropomodulin-4, partial [Varanus komodoensis]